MRATLDFLLNEWLDVEALTQRPRFADHSTETFASVLDMSERLAATEFAPLNRLVDTQEPHFDGERVVLPRETHGALAKYAASGMFAATQDEAMGGMQLPFVVEMAASAFFYKASIGISSYAVLTTANANLLMVHGTERQKQVFAVQQLAGRWFGTMCLSEPQAGSSLSDIATRAVPDGAGFEDDALGARYRLTGNKMWISGGDHEITENIVHLVLAKIPGPDGKLVPGTRGISLFIVPKMRVNAEGALTGERNDVALAGLNHKLGNRGTTNCLLNFGEHGGAAGYRVGAPGEGLRCMFHMMNEARIRIGLGATALGMAGYEASVEYANTRTQGRRMSAAPGHSQASSHRSPQGEGPQVTTTGKDAGAPPVAIIGHADVRRMLLAQKAYAEGALALALYSARLVDEQHTGDPAAAKDAALLLELLTPIAKSWPSEWCLEANSLAIQVHGGYGYTRDFAVEQYWRDNRLNMIHEGTHGVQALDLLGRKVPMEGGAALRLLLARIQHTVTRATELDTLRGPAAHLAAAVARLEHATQACQAGAPPEEALANAVPYLQGFGHVVLAWVWLDIAVQLDGRTDALARGKQFAMRYFFAHELPKADAWLAVVASNDLTCLHVPVDCF
ncbi:acyl-CoA dehydrogenase [Hydrogenophaga sp.]|uniref:acyl-CoA dehydrogenase n=1 Tax=Hydrogenophaga sp. TaxID=1904254 RepID=UPI002718C93E|nr:acyl-CoA dehydrogenase [Hydrogenophaga sp.]MDO9434876.1 acyl-CoA dehydrogenase [Hydrogenophaga sp.]